MFNLDEWHLQSVVFGTEWRVVFYCQGEHVGVMFDKGEEIGYVGVKYVPSRVLEAAVWFASTLKAMEKSDGLSGRD